MKIIIEIPEEYESEFKKDRFDESLECVTDELEKHWDLVDMLRKALLFAEVTE